MAGLPQAMIKKREILRAQEAGTNPPAEVVQPRDVVIPHMDGPSNTPIVETPPVEIKPAVIPTEVTDDWKAEAQKMEQRYKSLQGVIESLEPNLRTERTKREELEREIRALREALPPPPPPPPNPEEELTDEEVQIYGEAQSVITKIARKIARGETSAAMADIKKELSQLREAQTRVQTDLTTTSEEQFMSHVKSKIPGFDTLIKSPEWQQYIATKAPYSRKTIYDMLTQAHMDRDLDTIVEIFAGYKPAKDALASMVSPTLSNGGAPVELNGKHKPTLKWSDRQKISRDFINNRITKDEKDKWDKLFKEAEAENRIDFNA